MLVRPGDLLWVDVLLPAGDSLWEDDVGRSFHWLGQAWVGALRAVGVEASWHDGPMICTPWCPQVCFAGIGPGEVTVDGRKAVGLAQRRTRAGALFQCAALLRWDGPEMARLVGLDGDAAAALANVAAAIAVGADELEQAFLGALPA